MEIVNVYYEYATPIEAVLEVFAKSGVYRRAGVMGALAFTHPNNPQAIMEFAKSVATGLNLSETSPALALRNYVAKPSNLNSGGNIGVQISIQTLFAIHAYLNHIPTYKLRDLKDWWARRDDLFRFFTQDIFSVKKDVRA